MQLVIIASQIIIQPAEKDKGTQHFIVHSLMNSIVCIIAIAGASVAVFDCVPFKVRKHSSYGYGTGSEYDGFTLVVRKMDTES